MAEVVHWNPRPRVFPGRLGRLFPVRRRTRINNFGDLLGPEIVHRMVLHEGLDPGREPARRLLAVGSILHFAEDHDVVWGAGVNGKINAQEHRFASLDVRAVRGPLSRAFLRERGIEVPEVYGDPGLLVSRLWPERELPRPEVEEAHVTVVPNLHDMKYFDPADPRVVDPQKPLNDVLARIKWSARIVASSLHGLVVADSFGIPATLFAPSVEGAFKYRDHLAATGRKDLRIEATFERALDADPLPAPDWIADPLMASFPRELWTLA